MISVSHLTSEELHAAAGAGVGSCEWDQPGGGSRGLQGGAEGAGDAGAYLHTCHPKSPASLQQWVYTTHKMADLLFIYVTQEIIIIYLSFIWFKTLRWTLLEWENEMFGYNEGIGDRAVSKAKLAFLWKPNLYRDFRVNLSEIDRSIKSCSTFLSLMQVFAATWSLL